MENLASQTLTQNFSLQPLFDVNFVQTLLISREMKENYEPRLKFVISSLEANIDPFDLSVFTPHLEQRVKTSGMRQMTGLGPLVPGDRVPAVAPGPPGHQPQVHQDRPRPVLLHRPRSSQQQQQVAETGQQICPADCG